MDDETTAGTLAYMAYDIVGHRRLDLAQTIARQILDANGSVTAEEVAAELDKQWVEPAAGEIADLVARQAQAAIAYHEREVDDEHRAIEAAEGQLASAQAALDGAQQSHENAQAIQGQAVERRDAAAGLLAAARAAGGDPVRAPGGLSAEARAEVADVASEALHAQGGNR